MNRKYTKYIIQMKFVTSAHDEAWYDYDDYFISVGEAKEAIKFYRKVHAKTHVFRITKRDFETFDTLIEEKND